MKQQTLIGGIVIVAIVLLGIWYFSSSNASIPAGTTDQAATTTTTTSTTGTTGTSKATPVTFKSIFTQSGNTQCDYNQTDSSVQGASVIHISGGKMHGEFRTTVNGVKTASIMIYNGGYLYSWKEGATTGTKSSIKTLADLPEIIPADLTSGAILGTASDNVSWNCHAWATDPSVFVLPTYVTFKAK